MRGFVRGTLFISVHVHPTVFLSCPNTFLNFFVFFFFNFFLMKFCYFQPNLTTKIAIFVHKYDISLPHSSRRALR